MNTSIQLIDAAAATQASPAQLGGKAWQLGQLRHFGLPVPDFFVIPAEASRDREQGLSSPLRQALQQTLAARGWLDQPLAVRSSAVGEDAAGASFAGIFRSCLNVRGLAAVEAAIREVWASLDTAIAAAYRERLGLTGEALMAVVIMPLLPAQAAGIAFTCDPVSGREDRIVVHANWGLGESLVGGEAAGDEYVFTEDTTDQWRLSECRIGRKASISQPAPGGGTQRQRLSAAESQAPVLTTAQAEELAALLRDAALAFDFVAPFFDLEWVWDGTRFWLTQSRPITRRARYTYPGIHTQPAIWTRGNTCEVMPEPLQPMDWNFSRRGCNDLLEQGWKLAGYPVQTGVQRAALFQGRLYLEASIMQWEAWDAAGIDPDRFNVLMGGHQPAIRVTPPKGKERWQRGLRLLRYLRRAPAMRRQGLAEVAGMHALAREIRSLPLPDEVRSMAPLLHRVLRPARTSYGMFFLQGSGGGDLSLLTDTLNRFFPGEGEALAAALLADGEPSETARQGLALLHLAQKAKQAGFPKASSATGEFAAALAEFMDQYGHRGHDETYLRSRAWADEPDALLAQLPALADIDPASLRARQQAGARAAWQRIPFWLRPWLKRQVRAANIGCNQREAARSALIALLAAARRLWRHIGQALHKEGALADPQAVFMAMPSELERYAAGELSASGLRARVAAREATFAQWQASPAPDWLSLASGGECTASAAATPASGASHPGQCWQGVPTGTGRAKGRARILRHPSEGNLLQPGEILVAPATDPGWTPLFLKIAGLVVETGGQMSHGAIVAREFALPAVVNLPGILQAIRDGDEIEVDGLRGEVRRC